ncbi:1-pyrroline-5-carboxylate dehydrogenase, partial [Lysinibacillus fusiformis]
MIPYKHEPFTDFSQEANYNAYVEAIKKVEGYLGQDYPLIIGGERITTEDKIVSYNPAKKTEVIGRVSKASKDLAEKAMQAADETFKTWKKVDPAIRA